MAKKKGIISVNVKKLEKSLKNQFRQRIRNRVKQATVGGKAKGPFVDKATKHYGPILSTMKYRAHKTLMRSAKSFAGHYKKWFLHNAITAKPKGVDDPLKDIPLTNLSDEQRQTQKDEWERKDKRALTKPAAELIEEKARTTINRAKAVKRGSGPDELVVKFGFNLDAAVHLSNDKRLAAYKLGGLDPTKKIIRSRAIRDQQGFSSFLIWDMQVAEHFFLKDIAKEWKRQLQAQFRGKGATAPVGTLPDTPNVERLKRLAHMAWDDREEFMKDPEAKRVAREMIKEIALAGQRAQDNYWNLKSEAFNKMIKRERGRLRDLRVGMTMGVGVPSKVLRLFEQKGLLTEDLSLILKMEKALKKGYKSFNRDQWNMFIRYKTVHPTIMEYNPFPSVEAIRRLQAEQAERKDQGKGGRGRMDF